MKKNMLVEESPFPDKMLLGFLITNLEEYDTPFTKRHIAVAFIITYKKKLCKQIWIIYITELGK